MKKIRLNPKTIDGLLTLPPADYDWIGFDPVDNCNLHCVYCHNARTKALIDLDKLSHFLENNIKSVEMFQFGCVMESTLDARLVDIMEMVSKSSARPTQGMRIHTNGTMLSRHDDVRMIEAGLTEISVSIDTVEADTFKLLRGGAKLEKALRNLRNIKEKHPQLLMRFVPTINTANIDQVEGLIEYGLSMGVSNFAFREMFHYPTSNIVDHNKMLGLLLPEGAFAEMRDWIEAKYGTSLTLHFSDDKTCKPERDKISVDSLVKLA